MVTEWVLVALAIAVGVYFYYVIISGWDLP